MYICKHRQELLHEKINNRNRRDFIKGDQKKGS